MHPRRCTTSCKAGLVVCTCSVKPSSRHKCLACGSLAPTTCALLCCSFGLFHCQTDPAVLVCRYLFESPDVDVRSLGSGSATTGNFMVADLVEETANDSGVATEAALDARRGRSSIDDVEGSGVDYSTPTRRGTLSGEPATPATPTVLASRYAYGDSTAGDGAVTPTAAGAADANTPGSQMAVRCSVQVRPHTPPCALAHASPPPYLCTAYS